MLSMLEALCHHSDELLVAGDNASTVLVKTRESELELRLTNIQQLLASHESNTVTQSLRRDFDRACSEAEQICEHVEVTIRDTARLTDDADEAALTTSMANLDRSLTQLVGLPAVQLTDVLPVTATDLQKLQHVSSHSHDLLCQTKDRCLAVHRQLLTRYDMARVCHEWLQFVAQIERELSSPLAGNFDAFLAQRNTFEASSVTLFLSTDFSYIIYMHIY